MFSLVPLGSSSARPDGGKVEEVAALEGSPLNERLPRLGLKVNATGKTFRVGVFETPSVKELEKHLESRRDELNALALGEIEFEAIVGEARSLHRYCVNFRHFYFPLLLMRLCSCRHSLFNNYPQQLKSKHHMNLRSFSVTIIFFTLFFFPVHFLTFLLCFVCNASSAGMCGTRGRCSWRRASSTAWRWWARRLRPRWAFHATFLTGRR